MNDKSKVYELNYKNYFTVVLLILFIIIICSTITNINYYIRNNNNNTKIQQEITWSKLEDDEFHIHNSTCLIITEDDNSESIQIIKESLKKDKISYIIKSKLEDINTNELNTVEFIIVDGSNFDNIYSKDMISLFIEKGKHIIFTSIPNIVYNNNDLQNIMGIKEITTPMKQEGIKFLSGFMLGGLLEFPQLSYNIPKVELHSTTKTYVIGEDKSSIIWRNIYNGSEIYVINGPFMTTNAGYGIMSAIMAQIYPDYIYPIINTKVFTYSGFPYISDENTKELKKTYNRNAMQLQNDILIPDILSINKSRNLIPSCFIANNKIDNIRNNYIKQVRNYERDINKLGGELGIVYSGDLQEDIEYLNHIASNGKINSLMLVKDEHQSVKELFQIENTEWINSVLGSWYINNGSFEFINENTVYIPITIGNTDYSDLATLEFYSGVTAYGAIIHNLNIEKVVYSKDSNDNWMKVSQNYIKFIDSYREKFKMIKARNISDTTQLIKKFVVNSPYIDYYNDKIVISFKKWYGESYYILRTDKKISSISNGHIEKIEEGAYLVTIKDQDVIINLKPTNIYK